MEMLTEGGIGIRQVMVAGILYPTGKGSGGGGGGLFVGRLMNGRQRGKTRLFTARKQICSVCLQKQH